LGYGEEELINLSVRDIHPRESLEHVISEFEAQGRGEKSLAPAIPCVRKDGTILYTDITTSKMLIDGKECNVGFFTDITDRKQAEEALRESETRFRTLFEAIPDTVLVHDDKGVILHINEIGAQRLEWSAKDLIGRNLREIVTSENAASISNHVRETHKVGWSRFETTYVSRSGWRTIAEVYEHPIVFGKKKAILSVARDITERKEVEEKLRASEEKYRDLVESINDIIYAIDEHGIVTYIAPTIESISGYTTSEIIGRSFFDFVYEEDTPSMKDEFQQDISDHPEPHEYRMVTKAGDIRWVRTFSRPFFEGDRIAGLRGVLTDITDRKQVEEALLHEKIFSDTIMDSSPGLFFVFDDKGNILRWNRNAEKFTEYSTQEISKMNVLDFVVPEDTQSAAEAIQEVLNKGQASVEITVLSKSGKKIPFYLTGLRTRIGNITCVVGSGFDITERKQTEEKVWESEERYRAIFEQAADSIVLIDTETGALVEFNNRAHENLGYTREDFDKLKISDVETIESAEEVAKHIEKIVKKGTDIFETKQRTKNGEIRDIQISSKAISIQGRDFLHSIWRDITERKQAEEALQHSYDQLQETFISAINALASTVEMKDQYTAGHQPRVTQLACAIAEEMGLSKNQIEGIRMAGLIHDIGKIVVPAEILNKPGPLTEVQYEMIKMHPQAGHDILKRIAFPWPVAQIVQQHHEMMDGSGYPQGLAGEDILPEARVMAVANVVEAMTAHRPYRPAYDIEEALAEISHNRGAKYDSAVVDACLRLFTERGFVFDSARY
jgi:PAS domain S-box-containing protein/putative nucleotidyltransferase with HDIG domain